MLFVHLKVRSVCIRTFFSRFLSLPNRACLLKGRFALWIRWIRWIQTIKALRSAQVQIGTWNYLIVFDVSRSLYDSRHDNLLLVFNDYSLPISAFIAFEHWINGIRFFLGRFQWQTIQRGRLSANLSALLVVKILLDLHHLQYASLSRPHCLFVRLSRCLGILFRRVSWKLSAGRELTGEILNFPFRRLRVGHLGQTLSSVYLGWTALQRLAVLKE